MNKPAAFQASYADWKLIKGRKVVQVVFEIPIEQAGAVHDVLGGMPNPASEVWCGIARLKQNAGDASPAREADADDGQATGPASHRPFASLPLPQQAALLCNDPIFRAYLNEEHNYNCETADDAAEAVRERCNVLSRSEITPKTPAGEAFIRDREQFIAWKLVSA